MLRDVAAVDVRVLVVALVVVAAVDADRELEEPVWPVEREAVVAVAVLEVAREDLVGSELLGFELLAVAGALDPAPEHAALACLIHIRHHSEPCFSEPDTLPMLQHAPSSKQRHVTALWLCCSALDDSSLVLIPLLCCCPRHRPTKGPPSCIIVP